MSGDESLFFFYYWLGLYLAPTLVTKGMALSKIEWSGFDLVPDANKVFACLWAHPD